MAKRSMFVGMDVHKESIDISLAEEGRNGEVRHYGVIPGDLEAVAKVLRALRAPTRQLRFVYEAGPCGFWIHRYLTGQGEDCVVVNPSNMPKRSGDRIKTDRRDGDALARLHRAGELTAIYIPTPDDEALRDLVRARERLALTREPRMTASRMQHVQRCGSSGAAPCWAASVNNRSSVGSVGGFARNHSFCSATDIDAILALISARASRMICTASTTFVTELLIAEDLPGCTNFEGRIPQPAVHVMVTMNSLQVDDVLEIPAYQHIHACDRSHRDVLGVRQHPRPQYLLGQVTLSEFRRWLCQA